MRYLIFLSCGQMENFVGDDHLISPYLNDIKITTVDWQKFVPEPKVQDAVIIRTTWDYHLHLPKFLRLLGDIKAAGIPLYNTQELVEWNSNKIYLKELKDLGVKIPESYFFKLTQLEQLTEITQHSKEDWVVKPQISASAHKTFWIKNPIQNETLLKIFQDSKGEDVIVQKFCKEVLDPGEISLIFYKDEFSHATLKTPQPGDFRVQEEHGGWIRSYNPSSIELETATSILKKVPRPYFYARVDMIQSPGGLLLMELELIEPSLYLRTHPDAPKNFARALETLLA